ncbi:GNAT family N-acetyltransferase [Gordonia desulfuricans]|uniref:GNAT family N-acetyltransferase n=1 Tax=Gordonia desulfuricans TaxID=89051 RepID=UPI000A698A26|nr:GNAT family N-acetyltransferase [Gordonia desulfuricans]
MRVDNGVPDVVRLGPDDAGEILTLQRAAYVSEAILHDDLTLPPLVQTLDELTAELSDPDVTALGIRRDGRLVAAVRLRTRGDTAELGRLTVVPDLQGNGLGTRLLTAIDDHLPEEIDRVELFTGERSVANIGLYRRLGYIETRRERIGDYHLVFMCRRV